MELTEAPRGDRPVVESYGPGGFRISGDTWTGSVLILADRVVAWDRSDAADAAGWMLGWMRWAGCRWARRRLCRASDGTGDRRSRRRRCRGRAGSPPDFQGCRSGGRSHGHRGRLPDLQSAGRGRPGGRRGAEGIAGRLTRGAPRATQRKRAPPMAEPASFEAGAPYRRTPAGTGISRRRPIRRSRHSAAPPCRTAWGRKAACWSARTAWPCGPTWPSRRRPPRRCRAPASGSAR